MAEADIEHIEFRVAWVRDQMEHIHRENADASAEKDREIQSIQCFVSSDHSKDAECSFAHIQHLVHWKDAQIPVGVVVSADAAAARLQAAAMQDVN